MTSKMNPNTGPRYSYYCTGCSSLIRNASRAFLHPLLECLICLECHTAYGTGDFKSIRNGVDEEGYDNLCRWCSDGGTLLLCGNRNGRDRCHYAFCIDCIRRNCPGDAIFTTENFPIGPHWRWRCFICAPNKLVRVKVGSKKAFNYLNGKMNTNGDTNSRWSSGSNLASGRG